MEKTKIYFDHSAEKLGDILNQNEIQEDERPYMLATAALHIAAEFGSMQTTVLSSLTGLEFDTKSKLGEYLYENLTESEIMSISIIKFATETGAENEITEMLLGESDVSSDKIASIIDKATR